MKRTLCRGFVAALMVAAVLVTSTAHAAKKDFKIAWSIYVGWMPWAYAAEAGIVKNWADKYGITIEVTQINDYIETHWGRRGCSLFHPKPSQRPMGLGIGFFWCGDIWRWT